MPFSSRFAPSRHLRLIAGAAAVAVIAVVAACTDAATLPTGVPPGPTTPPAADSARPIGAVLATGSTLEVGDSVRVIATDDRALQRATLVLADSVTGLRRWASMPVALHGKADTAWVRLTALPNELIGGPNLRAIAVVEDTVGRARAGDAPDTQPGDDPTDLLRATPTWIRLSVGQSLALGSASRVSGMVVLDTRLLLSDGGTNEIRALDLESLALLPSRVRVGSAPGRLAVLPGLAVGVSRVAVANNGGSHISIVELPTTGAWSEVRRIAAPRLTARFDMFTIAAAPTSSFLVAGCPTPDCATPRLLVGGAGHGTWVDSAGIAHEFEGGLGYSVDPAASDPYAALEIVSPSYSPHLPEDFSTTVESFLTDTLTLQDTLVGSYSVRSGCTTLLPGIALWASSTDPNGLLYLVDSRSLPKPCGLATGVEDDAADGATAPSARVIVLSRHTLQTSSLGLAFVTQSQDIRLRSASAVTTTADGALAAFATAGGVRVTDQSLRILGTVGASETGSEPPADARPRAVAFLEGQRGTVGALLAVAFPNEIVLYDLDRFAAVARFPTKPSLGRLLALTRAADGSLRIVAALGDRSGVVVIRAPQPSATAVRAGPARASRH